MTQPDAHAHWRPSGNPWAIAIVVTLAAFMEILDTTIVNVALPHIAGSLSASNDEATWALTSYLVANAIVLTISGWLSAVIGRKRYFMICLAMFTVCSFLCGIANSLPQLVLFRLLPQGQRARIGRGGFGEKLARALKIGERRQRVRVLGMRVDHRLQMLARFLGLSERFEQQRGLHIRVDAQRVRFGHAVVKVYRGLFLLQPLVDIGEREGGQRIIGRERQRQA